MHSLQTQAASDYAGHRMLEAMRSAPRYADAIYASVRDAAAGHKGPILDFGAGDGVFAERFLRDGIAVDCVEPDKANQVALTARGHDVVSDIAALASEHYAFAYTINVLEHIRELDHYLAELHRVLRQGATLFVFVPAFNLLWTSLDEEVEHIQRFTRRTLARRLMAAGFDVESSRYFDSVGFFAALAVRFLESVGLFSYSPATVGFYDRLIFPVSQLGDHAVSSVVGKNVIAVARKSGMTSVK
jgi:SAM-dependent methyltransferase